MNNYPVYRYDEKFVLKVSPLLKVIFLYSLRHLVFILLAYNPIQKLGGSLDFLKYQFDPLLVMSDIPALLLVYAWANRNAGAPLKVQALWHKGRGLLAASAVLHLTLMLWLNAHEALQSPVDTGFPIFLQGLVDVGVLLYLFRSSLVKDIFADYPGGAKK